MKIDACAFVGESLRRNSVSIDQLLNNMDKNGVDRSVVRPLIPCDYNYDKANQRLAEEGAKNSRIIPFGRINPWEKDAAKQVEKVASYGMKGIHLHPWEENYSILSGFVEETLHAAQSSGLIVYLSAGYPCVSEPLSVLELAQTFPDITFIATHAAQLDISGMSLDDATILATQAPNVCFDLCAVYRRDYIEKLQETLAPGRVVFGSCSPYMDLALEIARVDAADISPEKKEAIFSGNIQRILGL